MIDRLLEFASLFTYLIVLLWIGVRTRREVRTSADFALAGRSVPWIAILATTAATMVGGGASIGSVSRIYEIGIVWAFITCAWHIQLILTGIFIAPALRKLSLVTVGDFFELKFGSYARVLAVINSSLFLLGALAAQMAAMGAIAQEVVGVDYRLALVLGAAVTVFYSTIGGIRAVVKTDVLQFAILVAGIGTAAAIIYSDNGGFSGMRAGLADSRPLELTGYWSPVKIISLFVAFMLGETFTPPYATRCFIAKDSRSAGWGVAGAGLFLLLFLPSTTFVLGLGAQLDSEVSARVAEGSQNVFPALLRSTFHPIFSGVLIAALVAAVMSSADSCLSCSSTLVMEDVYRRVIRRNATDRQLLSVARWSTVVTGVGAAVWAYFQRDVAELLEFVYDFWAPTMVLPFVVGLYFYRRNRIPAVVASMTAGLIVTLGWRILTSHDPGLERTGWTVLAEVTPALAGVVVSIVVFAVALPLTRRLSLGKLLEPHEVADLPQKEECDA